MTETIYKFFRCIVFGEIIVIAMTLIADIYVLLQPDPMALPITLLCFFPYYGIKLFGEGILIVWFACGVFLGFAIEERNDSL